jgi:hypothetical protein
MSHEGEAVVLLERRLDTFVANARLFVDVFTAEKEHHARMAAHEIGREAGEQRAAALERATLRVRSQLGGPSRKTVYDKWTPAPYSAHRGGLARERSSTPTPPPPAHRDVGTVTDPAFHPSLVTATLAIRCHGAPDPAFWEAEAAREAQEKAASRAQRAVAMSPGAVAAAQRELEAIQSASRVAVAERDAARARAAAAAARAQAEEASLAQRLLWADHAYMENLAYMEALVERLRGEVYDESGGMCTTST